MKLTKQQVIFFLVALALIVLLFFLPRTSKKNNNASVTGSNLQDTVSTLNFGVLEDSALNSLSKDNQKVITTFNNIIKSVSDKHQKATLYDSLGGIWDVFNHSEMAAINYEQAAKIANNEKYWTKAGDAYFDSFRYLKAHKLQYINKALACYNKVLAINPDNLDAQTSLGVCYVEGSAVLGQPPMKGIGMLLAVLNKDPNNLNALVNLGYFAIESGQYDKAEQRFKQVLKTHPKYAEAYVYLTDLALNKGDTATAISNLKQYKKLVKDTALVPQVNAYLKKLEHRN